MTSNNWSKLFLISFAALFFEVLVIRWLSTEIRIFGYFKNLILMGAFVGLGLGCASAGKAESGTGTKSKGAVGEYFPYLLLVLTGLIAGAPYIGLNHINFVVQTDVFFWLQQADIVTSIGQLVTNIAWVIVLFLLVVSVFDSLGQRLGEELAKQESLNAYSVNLGGSAAGVLIYNVLAFMKTSPGVWLLVGIASVLPFYKKPPQLIALLVSVIIAFWSVGDSQWSPYYCITTKPYTTKSNLPGIAEYRIGTAIDVNHVTFQRTIDMAPAFVEQHPELKLLPEYATYNVPYQIRTDAQNVLVLGAGSGNDVSAALRHNVKHVDAVEIDPTILSLGKTEHPEKPYSDPRVSAYVNDARNFLSSDKTKYDLIVFGFVDSTVSFSMLSSVRLDNFLYTIESLKMATEALAPDGVASLSFAAGAPWVRDRLFQMVQSASGMEPIALNSVYSNNNSIIILWGPGVNARRAELLSRFKNLVIPTAQLTSPLPLCTDDWPFLYQKERALTYAYGAMLALLLLIAGSLTISRFRLQPKSFFNYGQFFLLGAGFLLLETRAMLAVAVLFGSTWLVSSIVIFLILIMAWLANWVVQRYPDLNKAFACGGLLISLVVLYMVPLSALSGLDWYARLGAAALVIGLPFTFAGLVFSKTYARALEPGKALGINILGALLGGCLEYFSVIIGTRDLVIIAFVLYSGAFLADYLLTKNSDAAPATTN
ncbi:MAG: hypothetical protein JST44_06825 [Cyanobacteria bacterium SZAS LIN-5]|nr:hypothetical protein [Cyanobacteria bacterium SZAS LIN-5]